MKLRMRLLRIAKGLGPPPKPGPPLTQEEILKRLGWWIRGQTYNLGMFDVDPEFRPAWSHYHDIWQWTTGGMPNLHSIWLRREQPDFEEARKKVVTIMIRVLAEHGGPSFLINALKRWISG